MQNDKTQLEYRVVKVDRYIVTRFTSNENGGSVQQRGEFDNSDVAHEVAYALCKREHEFLGWDMGDMRIQYPHKELTAAATASQ